MMSNRNPDQTAFVIGVTGTIVFLAVAILAAVSAGGTEWAEADALDSKIGLFKACGVAFGYPGGCTTIDQDSVVFIAAAASRWHRFQGMQALTILSAILAGATAFLCLLLAIRSKRPSPQLASVPIYSGAVVFVMGVLVLALFSTLKTDAFRIIPGLVYGASFGTAIIPFAVLTQLAWEDALLAARASGAAVSGMLQPAMTPKSRATFTNFAVSP